MVVSAVGLNNLRCGQKAPRQAADEWNLLHQRHGLDHVVAVGFDQDEHKLDPLGFGDDMVFGARASALGGIRSCFLTGAHGANGRVVDDAARPVNPFGMA